MIVITRLVTDGSAGRGVVGPPQCELNGLLKVARPRPYGSRRCAFRLAYPPGGGSRIPPSSSRVICTRLDHQGLYGRIPIQGDLPQRATVCRLSPRIQRNPQAESLLSGCAFGPLE